jgi:cytochrome c-type biogenesis protein CcmH
MRRLFSLWRGLPGWILLALVVVVALVIGSIHPPPSTDAARIARLDSIIKCPSCDDLSIAESDASTAVALRALVATDVHGGETDAQIEAYVVGRYGSSILLSPADSIVWVLPVILGVVVVGAFTVVMWRRRKPPVATAEDEQLVAAALGRLAPADAAPGGAAPADAARSSEDQGATVG